MMKFHRKLNVAVLVALFSVAAAIVVGVVIVTSSQDRLYYTAQFYFVYYRSPDDAASASSVSSTVQSYGGAGHVVGYGGKYYVTVACYYSRNDADDVCANLKKRGLDCSVLEAEVSGYDLPTARARENAESYKGTLATLYSLSEISYNAANSLDTDGMSQDEIKGVISDVRTTLNGLLRRNSANCFTAELAYLVAECEDAAYGYVRSGDVRKIQIAIADCILNVKLS